MNRGQAFISGTPETIPITSPEIPIVTGATVYTWAHGLPYAPKDYEAVLLCVKGELGYNFGDETPIANALIPATVNPALAPVAYFQNLTVLQRNSFGVSNKTTAVNTAITEANWRLKFYIWP